jgi:hypothetical protein
MTYPILVVMGLDETPNPLYPSPGDEPNTVKLLPDDGQTIRVFCNALRSLRSVNGHDETMGELAGCEASLFITEKRVAVACSKYDKGGRLRGYGAGGLAVAGLANVASMALAAHRRRGQMLVGHVQFEWLAAGVAWDRKGRGSANQIRLLMRDPTADGLVKLNIQLDKRNMASPYLEQIMSRAAHFQAGLAQSLELKEKLEAYALSPERTVNAKTNATSFLLPTK